MNDQNQWPSWNTQKSDKINPVAAILSAKEIKLDQSRADFCFKNKELLTSNLVPKLYLGDRYPLEKQREIDRKSSYDGYLYKAYKYWAYQSY